MPQVALPGAARISAAGVLSRGQRAIRSIILAPLLLLSDCGLFVLVLLVQEILEACTQTGYTRRSSRGSFFRLSQRGPLDRRSGQSPLFVRPCLYWLCRYLIKLGLLDGVEGFVFHFFQCLWYRSLVDVKVLEARR